MYSLHYLLGYIIIINLLSLYITWCLELLFFRLWLLLLLVLLLLCGVLIIVLMHIHIITTTIIHEDIDGILFLWA
jgi:hypothetical protein